MSDTFTPKRRLSFVVDITCKHPQLTHEIYNAIANGLAAAGIEAELS